MSCGETFGQHVKIEVKIEVAVAMEEDARAP
jgi:hypothetical protein